jgi:replication-associated recombination protein RarA
MSSNDKVYVLVEVNKNELDQFKHRMNNNKPKRNRKPNKKLPEYKGKLDSIQDMIELAKQPQNYININVPKLRAIRQELESLNKMVGLESFKKSIFEQLLFYLQNLHLGSDMYMNTVIYGPPGVGKTTVAKLLGEMFSKLGVLSGEGIFEEARRDTFVGQFVGETAMKTQEFLEDCLGGVVFVDEVYSLGQDGKDGFSKEAIDCINLFLSENKDDFMMIVAGYKEEVEQNFFRYNQGLRRRFMWYHTIEDYSSDELKDIFHSQIHQNKWSLDSSVDAEFLSAFFKEHKDKFPDNGGSIENFITVLKIKHSRRVLLLDHKEKRKINKEDLKEAVKAWSKSEKKQEFMSMYM